MVNLVNLFIIIITLNSKLIAIKLYRKSPKLRFHCINECDMNTEAHPVRACEAFHGRVLHHRDCTAGGSLGSNRFEAILSFYQYCMLTQRQYCTIYLFRKALKRDIFISETMQQSAKRLVELYQQLYQYCMYTVTKVLLYTMQHCTTSLKKKLYRRLSNPIFGK